MELEKQTILIVDDSRLNLKMLSDILDNEYEVISTTSGKQALDIVMSRRVDLILLDVMMPKMDGYEVCTVLKNDSQTKNIPVVFVSAMRNVEDETRGLVVGAIDYIFKPFNSSIIRARVKNHLELKRYRDILEKMSNMDGLTGLANRRYFDEVYDLEWRRAMRNGDALSILMIDIDGFKKFNDTYGHLAGDDCLRHVGRALENSARRAGDFVARYGGEEFVIILPSALPEAALKVAEKVRENIRNLKIINQSSEVSEYVTVSVGISTMRPSQSKFPASLVDKADKALYQAKRQGRDKVVVVVDDG